MNYLLDTNVISEVLKSKPNANVSAWMSSFDINQFCLSVLTIGELKKSIEKLPVSAKKNKILNWLETDILQKFLGRIIDIDINVADKWGYISSRANLPAIDSLIAASALVHNLKLVTRNTKDFDRIPALEIINPWEL